MNKKTYYITTPIYYPSANPHVGTAYTTVLADVLTRYKKLLGHDAFFTTGTDEHALKILLNAKKANKTPKEFVDDFALVFKKLWQNLGIDYSTFIRTSDEKHKYVVQRIYEKLDALGLIELKEWKGWYCNSCEENYALNNIVKNGDQYFCTQGHLLVERKENSLFFKMSEFTDWIKKYLFEINPNLIYPTERRNELFSSFIKDGLEDLSISRINSDWGIEVLANKYREGGKTHVAYVWIDALFSYLSALNFLQEDDSNYQKYWNNKEVEIIHLMSKEITRFHAIYWPIFLHSLDLNLPTKIISHGWIITPEGKMSKSLGNVIDPNDYINLYGRDALRFFFIKGLILENDSVFSKERFIEIYNTYLANTFGNLVSRTISMLNKYNNGFIPGVQIYNFYGAYYIELLNQINRIKSKINLNDLNGTVDVIYELNQFVNDLIEKEKPWELFSSNNTTKLFELLHLLVNIIRVTYYYLSPILIDASKKVFAAFDIDFSYIDNDTINNFRQINGKKITPIDIIFKRLQKD